MIEAADPGYRGLLSNAETVSLLQELLLAERAGALACARSLDEAPTAAHRRLLADIQRDEATSCRGLRASLEALGATAQAGVGAFADRCLAIADFEERLRFLNRGQRWVVDRLERDAARIEHEGVRRQLAQMLQDHRRNVARVDHFLRSMQA